MSPTKKKTHPTLDDSHRAELNASGISDETIEVAGVYSAQDAEIREILGWQPKACDWGRAMVLPFLDFNGKVNGYARVKLNYPRYTNTGKAIKYESPRKGENRAYFPPGFGELFAKGGPILVTEGEKKALAVSQLGIACIGFVGIWGFQQKRLKSDLGRAYGERKLIADLATMDWKGRDSVTLFDSDAIDNPSIQLAENRLAEVLTKRGANARVARLPQLDKDGKTGVDDFIVYHGDAAVAELRKVMAAAVKPEAPSNPSVMDWAKMFRDDHFRCKEGDTLRWWRDEYWWWDGRRYVTLPESELRAITLEWLDLRMKKATPRFASDVVKGLGALCRVGFHIEQPTMLGDGKAPHRSNIIAFRNGLLDITNIGGELALEDPTPRWFSPTCLNYAFDPEATCPKWEVLVRQVLGSVELIETLRRFFGLLLVADTSYQKILLMVGPRRSGKGTILRTIQAVIGVDNCVSPTFSSLSGEFGLWQLLGKAVCMFPDAELGRRADEISSNPVD